MIRDTQQLFVAIFLAGSLSVLPVATGWAATETTQTTVTTTAAEPAPAPTPVVEKTTVVERKPEFLGSSPGVLGGAFHVIGVVLAFPFHVVAGVIEFIF